MGGGRRVGKTSKDSTNNSGSGSSGTASTSAAPDRGNDGSRMNSKLLLEKKRKLGSTDIDLAYMSDGNNGLAEEDEGSCGGSSSSSSEDGKEYKSNAEAATGNNASHSTTPPSNSTASNKRRHAIANKDKAYFTSPDEPPARRFRRKPDEMYEEWEKSGASTASPILVLK